MKIILGIITILFINACSTGTQSMSILNTGSKTYNESYGWGNGYTRKGWNNNISPKKWNFTLANDIVRYGTLSERYEVRDGDCGGSDCTNPRYRSEIMAKKNLASPNQEAWYGWSFYNVNIPSFNDRRKNPLIVVGQWKYGESKDGISPPIKLQHRTDGYVWVQLDDMRRTKGTSYKTCRLWHMEANQGRWVDIVMQTNWGTDSNGYLNIWINGLQKCNYKGQILANWKSHYPKTGYSWGNHLTHRHGVYVSSTKRFRKNFPNSKLPTFIAYYDEFRQGTSRKDVDISYIIQNNLKAVD